MSTTIQFKRRSTAGIAGAPSSLKSGEPAYNMADGKLYIGYGDDGSGNATSVKVIGDDSYNALRYVPAGGASGSVLTKSAASDFALTWTAPQAYTAGTGLSLSSGSFSVNTSVIALLASPTFTGVPAAPTAAAGTSTTQIATTAFVTAADNLKAPLASPTLTGVPAAPTAAAGTNTTQIATTAFVVAADALKANLASPAFTGTPTAPTPVAGTNNTTLATTAFVKGSIDGLLNGAGAAYDTLKELQDAIIADEGTVATLTTVVGGKLTKTANLSDLSDVSAARASLGLNSMALQAANAVAITGGTIDNVVLDGGTF